MNKLERYQAYAEKCASKLEVTDKIILRWSGGICKVKGFTHAHCHISIGEYPRGTICLNRSYFALAPVTLRHHTLAHEVTHLAVKSAHRSPTFDRRMVALGVANESEKRNAKSTKGHKHEWGSGCYQGIKSGIFRYCHTCHKKEYLT